MQGLPRASTAVLLSVLHTNPPRLPQRPPGAFSSCSLCPPAPHRAPSTGGGAEPHVPSQRWPRFGHHLQTLSPAPGGSPGRSGAFKALQSLIHGFPRCRVPDRRGAAPLSAVTSGHGAVTVTRAPQGHQPDPFVPPATGTKGAGSDPQSRDGLQRENPGAASQPGPGLRERYRGQPRPRPAPRAPAPPARPRGAAQGTAAAK